MNFLQIAQRLRQEAGASDGRPTAVASQTGELKRQVDWVIDAWTDLQNLHPNWDWMRASASVAGAIGDNTHTPTDFGIAATFGSWITDSFRLYTTAIGRADEQFLPFLDYPRWRDYYDFGNFATQQTRPQEFTINPADHAIKLGPTPDLAYTVTAEYYKTPTILAADSDTPALPSRFHMIIVWYALTFYGSFESAPESYSRAKRQYDRMLVRLEIDQLPALEMSAPLVV